MVGTFVTNLLNDKSKTLRLDNLEIDSGNVPSSLLKLRLSSTTLESSIFTPDHVETGFSKFHVLFQDLPFVELYKSIRAAFWSVEISAKESNETKQKSRVNLSIFIQVGFG